MSVPISAIDLPLSGVRVVEASAGTGKTFTIATLYLRAVLERGLMPERIVVATFARDAAAELSMRLRKRLRLAVQLLSGLDPINARDDDNGEVQATRAAIRHALDQDDVDLHTLHQRARAAELAMDTAAIGTLHAFCNRLLNEFGFETGRAPGALELLEDLRGLQTEIIADFWRAHSSNADMAMLLARTWRNPDGLIKQVVDPRWRGRDVEIPQPDIDALLRDLSRLRECLAAWSAADFTAADIEIGQSFIHPSARSPRIDALRALQAWACATAEETADASAEKEAARFLADGEVEKLKSFRRHPQGALFDQARELCRVLTGLHAAREAQLQLPAAQLLREARAFLDRELPLRMRALDKISYDRVIDELATALDDPRRGDFAVARIRERYPCALVDEFQDTDPQQWRVLEKLFVHAFCTLILVGDPKQAIYGFRGGDVHAWLTAKTCADGEPMRLLTSQRSGQGMCDAVDALFTRPHAFVETGIDHVDVQAAERVAARALLIDGVEQKALTMWHVPSDCDGRGKTTYITKPKAEAAIEAACVARIVALLNGGQRGTILLRDGDGKTHPLCAGDIAVLVENNRQAYSMQRALSMAGVAASCRLRVSVYASDEALELLRLLDALRDPADASRARAAQTCILTGADAQTIAMATHDTATLDALLQQNALRAQQVERHGVLAFLHEQIAAAAPRLLALTDGSRRIANYLQLAELLQSLSMLCFGLDDLCERYARQLIEAGGAESDTETDAARLRLESDARSVQIATVHAAKGLEYGVVFLPYAGFGKSPDRKNGKPALTWYHDGNRSHVAIGAAIAAPIAQQARAEQLAERMRVLYVGVTRARAACVLPWGWFNLGEHSAVHWLLHKAGRESGIAFDAAGCADALRELATCAPRAIAIEALSSAGTERFVEATTHNVPARAATVTRVFERDWRNWSFSGLVRNDSLRANSDAAPGTGDASSMVIDEPVRPSHPTLAGPRFGSAVHAALERADFALWRDAKTVPESERALLSRCLRAQGLPVPGSIGETRAIEIVGDCMRGALNATLPCGVRLCELPTEKRRAEMEFHLRLRPLRSDALFALLHDAGYQRGRTGIGETRLHGLLTGVIDLVFEHDGRYHLIDYKTNLLPAYDAASLQTAIGAHDYDLQYLLYTLALHRWLRQVLRGYDYDAHIGDVYYLFVRDLADGRGIHRDRPSRALIEAMDALFDARTEIAA